MSWLNDPCSNGEHGHCSRRVCRCTCGHRDGGPSGPALKQIEVDALRLWAMRRTLPQIAAELNYSLDNIKFHLGRARQRWGVGSTTELMDKAIAAGWPIR